MFSRFVRRAAPMSRRLMANQTVRFMSARNVGLVTLTTATTVTLLSSPAQAGWFGGSTKVNYDNVREDIKNILDDEKHDDGSLGPIFVRLAWHASGTFSGYDGSGGSCMATMRFSPESDHGANAGLGLARDRLEAIKKKHPGISYGDLWTLASVVAIEEMGGPKVAWRPGRKDGTANDTTPDGRLPDADVPKGQSISDHIQNVFKRMGFSDREIVALLGAHTIGRCHTTSSGFDGPWTNAPTTFSNLFFIELVENTWTERKWDGPRQFEDKSKQLMMLPSDMALIENPQFKKYTELYAKDEAVFFQDFAKAYTKLTELGVKF